LCAHCLLYLPSADNERHTHTHTPTHSDTELCNRYHSGRPVRVSYPRPGQASYECHLRLWHHVVKHRDGWIQIHQLLLHWLDVEYRMMSHVATTQLVFVRNFLLKHDSHIRTENIAHCVTVTLVNVCKLSYRILVWFIGFHHKQAISCHRSMKYIT